MLQGLEEQRGERGAPINNTQVCPSAVALPCMCMCYLLLHSYCMAVTAGESNTSNTLPTALGFLFHLTDFYFGTEWLRVDENGCSSAVV